MLTVKIDAQIYPADIMTALDRVMDGLPPPDAIALESAVMSALHRAATTICPLAQHKALAEWPELQNALDLGDDAEAAD